MQLCVCSGPSLSSSDDGAMETDDNQPGTSSGNRRRPPNDDHTKPKTTNQLRSESVVQKIISDTEGCAYDFRLGVFYDL